MASSRYADLTRDQLAVLVPELLLIGQLIDRYRASNSYAQMYGAVILAADTAGRRYLASRRTPGPAPGVDVALPAPAGARS